MATVNTYLTFNGNCELAFKFYQSAFGGELKDFNRFGDMPQQEGAAEDKNKIMHVNLPISAETTLYGSDSIDGFSPPLVIGNNFSISIAASSKEEADDLCTKLSAEGTVTMPLADTFWGAYVGMWTDQFGINWMVNYDKPTA
ncbi:PhnB protein [Pedobacter sp. UYP30]|uniref:VOC family protein n=1 Tax=Pedobacter sp. UYP30 TaxID=1756400 RepID=UPI003398C5D4